jgi:2-hydroxychromene-2-carboxylate isomerase
MADIEYFYAAHSAFAYLGSARFMEIAAAAGRRILHRPVDLRKVVAAASPTGFAERSKAHRAYYFGREIERWSEYRNAPVMGGIPTYHHHDIGLPNCMLIAAQEAGGNVDGLAHAMLRAHWRDDADLADRDTLHAIAAGIGVDAAPLLAAADAPEIRALYDAYTEEAIARSVFGSPTYFVDGDMFYGQDHLELVERALRQPFKGTWPK